MRSACVVGEKKAPRGGPALWTATAERFIAGPSCLYRLPTMVTEGLSLQNLDKRVVLLVIQELGVIDRDQVHIGSVNNGGGSLHIRR